MVLHLMFDPAGRENRPVRPSLVMIVAIVVTIMVTIPVALGVPTLLVSIPPAVVLVPAAFPLGVQVTAPFLGLAAVFAMLANGLIQS
jgi:hypothetical protein